MANLWIKYFQKIKADNVPFLFDTFFCNFGRAEENHLLYRGLG